ncbi:MAG TPA: glycosyltransferase [Candidatus Acidoferrales bacterium]|nr:glycosyltransferase [Candidatus Acidoferrales bacterium]
MSESKGLQSWWQVHQRIGKGVQVPGWSFSVKFVIEAIGVKTGGGVEVTLNLLRQLAGYRNHRIVALVPDLPPYDEVAGYTDRAIRFPPNVSLIGRHGILSRAVPRICGEERADVLLCLGNFAPATAPCPAVVLLQNAWYLYDEPTAWHRLSLREKLIIAYGRRRLAARSGPAHVIVQTPVMKRRLAALRGGVDAGITVIPTAPPLPPPEQKPASAGSHEPFTFLCLSRYAAHKNFEILLDAAKILRTLPRRPFRCVLTTGPDQHPGARKLLRRIEREGLQELIVNRGPVPRGELAGIFAEADAHLLPTLLETAGLTYGEAMHFGLPILTSDRDFARERCQDAAVYFDPLDAESVAKAMARVMDDADLRARLVANGKRVLATCPAWDEITAQFVEVLERVATGKSVADRKSEAGAPFVHPGEPFRFRSY